MASELAEQYREAGKEDLADEVDSLEAELNGLLAEATDRDEEEYETMSLSTKREMATAIADGGTTNAETVEVDMSFPVHGGEEPKFNTETVEYERPEPRTYTEEVPIEGGDDPETITVEREDYSPTSEEVIEWGNEHLNADKVDGGDSDIPAPGEVSREKQDNE